MGCLTYIYKKVTTSEDCIRLIEGALKNAKDTIAIYTPDMQTENGFFHPDYLNDQKEKWKLYMEEVKKGNVIYDPDNRFCYMSNGQWIDRFDVTWDDIVTECMTVIAKCQDILMFPLLKSFEELKSFIIENSRFWGFDFFEYLSLEEEIPDYIYFCTKIYDGEIYVNSDDIQHEAFKNCRHFRVHGYPCTNVDGCPWYYQTSPAGKPVFGWDNADDLIEFLEWYKTADDRNPKYNDNRELIINDPPEIDGYPIDGYNEQLYTAIREFFEVNKDKNLLVHFG